MARSSLKGKEAEIVAAYRSGETLSSIAERFGCHISAVHYHAAKAGLPRRIGSSGDVSHAAVEGLYLERPRPTLEQIAAKVGVSRGTVKRILISRKVFKPRERSDGITSKQVAVCVRLARLGLSYPEIAKQTGLSTRQVKGRVGKVMPLTPLEGCRRRWARARLAKAASGQ